MLALLLLQLLRHHFLTAFFAFLATELAALTARFATDLFFAFLATVLSLSV
jgi:hypothetical protein